MIVGLHKLSRQITNAYDCVCIEDLNMQGMSQALHFGKTVADDSWGTFTNMRAYKLQEQGKQIVKIDKYFPSSKMCSHCGNVKETLSLSERIYSCDTCGKQIVKIDKYFPSSKMCSHCGNVKETLSLSERIYSCDTCGTVIDRDYNASINIKNEGMPSSKMCSHCGNVKETLSLSERIYSCDTCGTVIDRDYNASINIKNEGMRIVLA